MESVDNSIIKIGIDARSLEGQRTGVGRYLINLLKHWAKETNVEFILYFKNQVPDDIPKTKNFQKKVLNSKSPASLASLSRSGPAGGNALFVHYHLCWAATKDKVDILFCPAYVAPIFYKGKIALVLHDIIYEARPDLYNWPSIFDKILLKKVSKISAKKADIIFTPSDFSKKEIIKYYKVDSKKIFVTPLAPDKKFNVGNRVSNIKKKFVFYVGAIIDRRFVPEMIKAFEKIAGSCPELVEGYKFLIVGKNYTDKQIDGNKIIHKDYINEDDLVLLYNSADLFIWLSEYEGFGLPPLEAMACGTPVLSTKKTSLAEVLGDYPIWVENPKDIDEISEKMLRILSDENLRKEMIIKGLAQAQKFSWQKTAEETLQILLK